MFKVSHKDPLNIIQGSLVIHTYKTEMVYHPKSRHLIFTFIHASTKGYKSTMTRNNILHFNTYYMSF